MAKYSFEFKLKIVQEYNVLNDRINVYKEFGEERLFKKRQSNNYSVQFKRNLIESYQTNEKFYREMTNLLEINNYNIPT